MRGLFRLLHARHVRRRPMRAVLAALSLAAGVALAVSVFVVQTSVDRSITEFTRTLAGPAPLRVVGPGMRAGLDASVLDRIRGVEGVGVAVPLVQAVTIADGLRGGAESEIVAAIGAECAMEAVFGAFGCDAAAGTPPPPLVSSALAGRVGDDTTLRSDVRAVRLAGARASARLDAFNRGAVVVFPLATAQELFGREGALDVVYVTPSPGTDVDALRARLEAAVGTHNGVLDADDPPPGIRATMAFMLALLGMLSLFTLGIGAMLARNTIVLSLVERRRDLAIAAAVGATPRMLTAAILGEIAVLGAVGGLLGAGGGALIARPVLDAISDATARLLGVRLDLHVTPAVVAVSTVLGVAAGVLATWRPARRAARLDVAAELLGRDVAAEGAPRRSVQWAVVFTGLGLGGMWLCDAGASGGGLERWQPIAVQVGMLVASLALVAAVGSIAPAVATLLGRLAVRAPGPVRLGIANVGRSRRTGVMVVAVGAAIGVAFSIASTTASIRSAIVSNISRETDRISIDTTPIANAVNIEGKPWPSTIDALTRVPGVAGVERAAVLAVRQPDNRVIGVIAREGKWALRLDGPLVRGTADLERFARNEVVVGPALARQLDVHPGDRIELAGRYGMTHVTVQGVEQFGDFGGRFVRMPMELLTRLYGPQPPYLTVVVEPGADPAAVARTIEAARLQPHLEASPAAEIADEIADETTRQIEPFWALQRALLVVSFLAVLFTLLLGAVQRRRELGVLGAVGMRPREVAAMMVTEGAVVGLIGTVLGSVAAVGFIVAMADTTAVVLGFLDPVRFDVAAAVVWSAVGVAVVAAAAAWPAWRAARTEVLPALQYE